MQIVRGESHFPLAICRVIGLTLLWVLQCGCTLSFNTKDKAFLYVEEKAAKEGMQFGGGSGVYAARFLGFTYSKSVSDIVGHIDVPDGQFVEKGGFSFGGKNPLKFSFFGYSDACNVRPQLFNEFGRLYDAVFSQEQAWVPSGKVQVFFVPQGTRLTKQNYSLRLGKRISLDFYFPCEQSHPAHSVFAAFLDITHELTHIVFELAGHVSREKASFERLATGAPACVYEKLAKSDPENLLQVLGPKDYLLSNPLFNETTQTLDIPSLCANWNAAFHAFQPHLSNEIDVTP